MIGLCQTTSHTDLTGIAGDIRNRRLNEEFQAVRVCEFHDEKMLKQKRNAKPVRGNSLLSRYVLHRVSFHVLRPWKSYLSLNPLPWSILLCCLNVSQLSYVLIAFSSDPTCSAIWSELTSDFSCFCVYLSSAPLLSYTLTLLSLQFAHSHYNFTPLSTYDSQWEWNPVHEAFPLECTTHQYVIEISTFNFCFTFSNYVPRTNVHESHFPGSGGNLLPFNCYGSAQ